MQTILQIIQKAGGWHPGLYLKIDNPPYMELVIEAMDESGPMGLPAISVGHYGEQNGDAMRDPEMCFELGLAGGAHLSAFYYRNDYVGVEQWSRNIVRGNYVHLIALHEQHQRFAKTWDDNLRLQGFAEAFTDKCIVMFLVRPGGQAQYSHMLSRQAVTSDPLRELQVWMLEHLRDDLTVEHLAERIGMSARHFSRVYQRETNMNPGQFVNRMRVEAAQQMIDSSSMGLKEIADACGFRSADSMRRAFLRVIGTTAGEYTERFRRSHNGH